MHFVIVVLLSVILAPLIAGQYAAPQQVIASNCTVMCGNITIPYPFGVEDGCFFNDHTDNITHFKINCTNNVPIHGENMEVLQISLEPNEIRMKTYTSAACYSGGKRQESNKGSVKLKKFTISSTKNVFVGMGCDTYVWFSGIRKGKRYDTGCMTICNDFDDVVDGDCNGIGCCEASLPDGISDMNTTIGSYYNHSYVNFNPCSAAFAIAKDTFKFHKSDLNYTLEHYRKNTVPVVYNWGIGNKSCADARADIDEFLCKDNTECEDSEDQVGYRCNCKKGFSGNPYLPQGCTDMNECSNKGMNNCEKAEYCVNTEGGFTCICPKGFHGNATTNNPCTSSKPWLITVLATAVLSVILGSIILFIFGWWLNSLKKRRQLIKQRAQYFERNGGLLLQQQMSSNDGGVDRIKIFTIEELEKATDNFNKHRILGKGGNGTVYKGMLDEGKIVAVKKSNMVNENQHEFINEVLILSQINHRNIVKLFGCSLEAEVPLLVYEFIPNGTLYHHIHDPSQEFPLTWKMRLQIASDSATALVYLHSLSSALIYHRDIKSSNILLDNKYRATLSDFGSSRSLAIDQTRVFTRVMGTFGYIDPEYFHSQQYTEKSDVYSFGVVLVELLTGQKAIRGEALEFERSLTSWFLSYWNGSNVLDIVDSRILEEGVETEFDAIAKLAKQCLNLDGKKRPTMKEVLVEIEVVLSVHVPKKLNRKMPQFDRSIRQQATYLNTFNLESSSSNSAELSLLFNPR